jgi:hypothetical protein
VSLNKTCEWRGGKQMRLAGVLIFAGAIASVSSILSYSRVDAQTNSTAASGRDASSKAAVASSADTKDKKFDLSIVSKAIADEASRLNNAAAGWDQKIQQLELDLNRSRQDDETTAKDVDEGLLILQAAAGRLGPEAEARVTLRKQEDALRELASRAEVHSVSDIRKTADHFQQKTTELHALNRSIEETRMGLMTQIDLLQQLKIQLQFNRATGQIGELLKRGEASLNSIQVIAARAQQLANDLAGFGNTPAAAAQSAEGTNPARASKAPAAVAMPAEALRRASRQVPVAHAPTPGNALRVETTPAASAAATQARPLNAGFGSTPAAVAKPADAHGRASRQASAAHAPGLAAVPGNALRAEIAPAASARATQAGPPNTKETAPGFILPRSRSPSPAIDSAHRMAAPSSPKPAAANPPPTTRKEGGVKVAPNGSDVVKSEGIPTPSVKSGDGATNSISLMNPSGGSASSLRGPKAATRPKAVDPADLPD